MESYKKRPIHRGIGRKHSCRLAGATAVDVDIEPSTEDRFLDARVVYEEACVALYYCCCGGIPLPYYGLTFLLRFEFRCIIVGGDFMAHTNHGDALPLSMLLSHLADTNL